MKKQDAFNKIKGVHGYVPYIGFYQLFGDDIPESVVNDACKRPEHGLCIIGSSKFVNEFTRVIEEVNRLNQI